MLHTGRTQHSYQQYRPYTARPHKNIEQCAGQGQQTCGFNGHNRRHCQPYSEDTGMESCKPQNYIRAEAVIIKPKAGVKYVRKDRHVDAVLYEDFNELERAPSPPTSCTSVDSNEQDQSTASHELENVVAGKPTYYAQPVRPERLCNARLIPVPTFTGSAN